MVTIGDEGFGPTTGGDGSYPFQIGAGGYNWQQNLEIETLDFATFHLYPQSCQVIMVPIAYSFFLTNYYRRGYRSNLGKSLDHHSRGGVRQRQQAMSYGRM